MSAASNSTVGAAVAEEGFAVPQSLQSSEQKMLLNIIDTLRSWDVGSFADLPQLIVCGIQSSGKSSVMEAISGVPFPRDVSTCTRFPTEVILRREPSTSVTVSIVPGKTRSSGARHQLESFKQRLTNYDGFPGLFAEASKAMGLSESRSRMLFSEDILKVEVTGPNQPQLTLVDLPGLIVSSEDDNVKIVEDMVRNYMQNPRSIILAVVTAGTDPDNQSVLKLAKEYDEHGGRTLGILTKPDLLENAPIKENLWREVVRNERFTFDLGWHILRNVDSGRGGTSREEKLKDRDQIEKQYFATSNFRALPERKLGLGIITLRERLSKILFQQIQTHLPKLLEEIRAGIAESHTELARLGRQRLVEKEQRDFLISLSTKFSYLCREAVRGIYDDDFFKGSIGHESKLCATVLNAHEEFARMVSENGCRWTIVREEEKDEENNRVTRAFLLEKAKDLLRANRAQGLPILMNPAVIAELFYECSAPWHDLARQQLHLQHEIVSAFLYQAINDLTDSDTGRKIYGIWIRERLEEHFKNAEEELEKVLAVYKRQPMTANLAFNRRLKECQRQRKSKNEKENGDEEEGSRRLPLSYNKEGTAEMALDSVDAYYSAVVSTFIDNVLTLAVWSPLVMKVPDIFSPDQVNDMTLYVVKQLAEETEEKRERRAQAHRKLEALEKGRRACESYNIPARISQHSFPSTSSMSKDADSLASDLQSNLNINERPVTPSPAKTKSAIHSPAPSITVVGDTPIKEFKKDSASSSESRPFRNRARLRNMYRDSGSPMPQYRNTTVEGVPSSPEF